jgi:hypothetical protein
MSRPLRLEHSGAIWHVTSRNLGRVALGSGLLIVKGPRARVKG